MPRERSENQAVDAFSAPRDLLRAAHLLAKKRRMTKSGFYRYCLAKEVEYSEQEALRVADNPGVGAFGVIEPVSHKRQRRTVRYAEHKRSQKGA